MAANGLQDLVLIAKEKRCSRAVGWKVTLKSFEILAVKFKKAVILKMVEQPGCTFGSEHGLVGSGVQGRSPDECSRPSLPVNRCEAVSTATAAYQAWC
jgi:hypothetical protein